MSSHFSLASEMSASRPSRRRSTITSEIFRDLLNGIDSDGSAETERSKEEANIKWRAQSPHILVVASLSVWFIVFVLLVVDAHVSNHVFVLSGLMGVAILTLAALKAAKTPASIKDGIVETRSGLYLENMAMTVREAEQQKREFGKLLDELQLFDEHFRWMFWCGILQPGTDEFRSWRMSATRFKALRRD